MSGGALVCLLILGLVPPLVAAKPEAAALIEGARLCAAGKSTTTKIAEQLQRSGWRKTSDTKVGRSASMTVFSRDGAELAYFSSKPMTQCIVSTAASEGLLDSVLQSVSKAFGREPKVEEAGKRYLYHLPRLRILTLQNKVDDGREQLELSVVY